MGGDLDSIGIAEARSAVGWWLDAGVDVAIQEEPRNWLQPPKPAGKAETPAPTNIAPPSHETLAELQQWLGSSLQLPLASAAARRILPHGPEGAPVMLLSDAPALEDFASNQPIGGDAWLLMQRMLAAIALTGEQAYSASLSCFHAPGSRMSDQDRAECAELARSHVKLVRPERLLLLGDGPCSAILGKRLIEARGHVHKVEGVRTIATFHPRHLIKRPLDKSLAWRDLLLLMEDAS